MKYNVLDNLKIKLSIDDNKFNISPKELFLMAARKNKKRSFPNKTYGERKNLLCIQHITYWN